VDTTVELKIADVVYPGKGLARIEGCVVFIPGVLTGEIVSARITRRRKNYAEAEIIRIDTPSPKRIEPACPIANLCPGCCYQHVDYAEELLLKQAQFISLLQRIGHVEEPNCLPAVPSPASIGYRNRITLHASRDSQPRTDTDKGPRLGYFALDNRSVLDIQACPLAVEDINHLLERLRADRQFMTGINDGQSLSLRYTQADGTLHWLKGTTPSKTRLTETTCLGPVLVPYNAFVQVNIPIADALIRRLTDILAETRPSAAIDLYCGAGIFALAAGKAGVPAVLGIDKNRPAIRAAKQNARRHELPGLQFQAMPAPAGLEYGLTPLPPAETALIVDPPRAGLGKEIIALIASHKPGTLIYISCAPDTLARDAARLSGAGYGIENTQIFDMFPRTPYFESITVFRYDMR